jgi:hypothetical protein
MKTWVEVIAQNLNPWRNARRKMPGMHAKEIGELLGSVRLWPRSGLRPSEDNTEEERQEPAKKKKKGQKTAAKRPTGIFELSDEDDEPQKRFTVYFDIEGPKSATTPNTGRLKTAPPPLVIKKGPFFYHTNDLFSRFKETIAAMTPCNPDLLVLASLTWKFDTPANGVCCLMTNEVGYEVMLTAVKGKKGECVVFMYMPPPKKDMVRDLQLSVHKNSPLL